MSPSRSFDASQSVPTRPSPGARVSDQGVSYCVWAPDYEAFSVLIHRGHEGRELPLSKDIEGFWHGDDAQGRAGDLYQFKTPDGRLLPDPASRFQPKGVRGPSQVVDPKSYAWRSRAEHRHGWRGQVVYELHIGTFTAEGTYAAATARLEQLRDLGIELVQLMPLADFMGERNWGYDGVAFYAPARCYGTPDELKALVDRAHELGLAVALDVVYNHVGANGNHLAEYCQDYFNKDVQTPWGPGLNLQGNRSGPVRDYLIENATFWLDEYRFDGLRLDATHQIPPSPDPQLVAEITDAVHARGGFVIAEDERNRSDFFEKTEAGGFGLDAAWADDWHHQVRVSLTGERKSYFGSFGGTPADLADAIEHGWTYRGQPFPFWENKPRGSPSNHIAPGAFVVCIENHDQVGNRPGGRRLEHLVTPAQFRGASLLLCLSPYTPMIFMGQEWAASSPFRLFTDYEGKIAYDIAKHHYDAVSVFNEGTHLDGEIGDPQDVANFEASKLRWEEREEGDHGKILGLYRDALAARHRWLTGDIRRRENWKVGEANGVVTLRYEFEGQAFMVLAAMTPAELPENWVAEASLPQGAGRWELMLHSDDAKYGGTGAIESDIASFQGPAVAFYRSVAP